MIISTLDRYLLWRSVKGALAVVVMVSLLVAGLDLMLRLADLTEATLEPGQSRFGLIARYATYRLPAIISPLVPLAGVTGVLIALVPMMRRGELVALAASGVGLRRCCRSAFVLAALLGIADVALSDQVAPRLKGPAQQVEAQLTGDPELGRIWRVESTGSTWFAAKLWLGDGGQASEVAVASESGRLLRAGSLVHEDGAWVLVDAIEDRSGTLERTPRLPAGGWLSLPYSPGEMADRLASHHALTSPDLLRRGGRIHQSTALQRWLRLVLPALCLSYALPLFVRFENRERTIQACGQALTAAAVPLAVIALGATATDNGRMPPWAMLAATLALAAAPAAWLLWRWRI